MPEAVRLVIWDLDEVLWKGTFTEGGIQYDDSVHQTVIALTQRGIMNSICSNNDHEQIKALLLEKGLWDYFIFPSIAWQPKGPRLQAIVEAAQLRPETILFVDDNPTNRAEAQHFVPGIQVSDESIVPEILASPLFQGKDDRGLTRLQHYKVLERRQIERETAGADRNGFLRASDIKVYIDYDVEANIDRAIELINRTNQLNFTKQRLPEDPGEAREALYGILCNHWIQAGLVRVSDTYGDYGFCGFYVFSNVRTGAHLLHYCFSCRILHMGVEQWLYDRLGRPGIAVIGEVLSDLNAYDAAPDWIALGSSNDQDVRSSQIAEFSCVVARGTCDVSAIIHYFKPISNETYEEIAALRYGIEYSVDHSFVTLHATRGGDAQAQAEAVFYSVGYQHHDLTSHLFSAWPGRSVKLLSFFGDTCIPVYRHKKTGVQVPVAIQAPIRNLIDLTDEALSDHPEPLRLQALRDTLRADFEYEGFIREPDFKANVRGILAAIPPGETYIIRPDHRFIKNGAVVECQPTIESVAIWLDEVLVDFPDIRSISLSDFVEDQEEQHSANFFDRRVYYRAFQALRDGRPGTSRHGRSRPDLEAWRGATPMRQIQG
jgi:FkbH-like protein